MASWNPINRKICWAGDTEAGSLWMPRFRSRPRAGLERLLRYCARPIFAMERLTWVAQDRNRLVYRLPKPMPDGRSQLYLSTLELLDRLAQLIPPPRLHRHRYHGAVQNISFLPALPGAALQFSSVPSPDVLSGRSPHCVCPQDKRSQLTPPNRLRSHRPAAHPSGMKLISIKIVTNTSSTKQSAGSGKNAERVTGPAGPFSCPMSSMTF
jgi:hypothetical protein